MAELVAASWVHPNETFSDDKQRQADEKLGVSGDVAEEFSAIDAWVQRPSSSAMTAIGTHVASQSTILGPQGRSLRPCSPSREKPVYEMPLTSEKGESSNWKLFPRAPFFKVWEELERTRRVARLGRENKP